MCGSRGGGLIGGIHVADTKVDGVGAPAEPSRRDFIQIASAVVGAGGAAALAWPFIDQMNPAADTRALASVEIDMSKAELGSQISVLWRGRPIFVRHRTPEQIAAAAQDDAAALRDPQTDAQRLIAGPDGQLKPEYLVLVGVCTHLGCVPLVNEGDYKGWFCPCHGSHYDVSGRIRKGPAPKNLEVPPYAYVSDTVIKVG